MDPLTHAAAGFVVGAAGGGGEVEIATAFLASLAPDAEFLTRKIPRTAFLDYHHGLTHTAFGGMLAAAGIAAVCSWITGTPWLSLLPFALAGIASHIILDLLMHNNGIALWAPFSRKRVAFPLVLGLNPRTASKHCKEGRYGTCFLCQAHGSLFNPFFWVLLAGTLIGLAVPSLRRAAAIVALVLLAIYSLVALAQKQKARRLVREETSGAFRWKAFPASFNLQTWLTVSEKEDDFESSLVDTRRHAILWSHVFPKHPLPPAVEKSKSVLSVRGFQNSVIFPYWLHETENGVDHIAWRDLSYSFSTDVELYALHIRIDTEGALIQNEFHERW
jgi:hypothetical protein